MPDGGNTVASARWFCRTKTRLVPSFSRKSQYVSMTHGVGTSEGIPVCAQAFLESRKLDSKVSICVVATPCSCASLLHPFSRPRELRKDCKTDALGFALVSANASQRSL